MIEAYLSWERELGRIICIPPLVAQTLPNLRTNPFGVIPKRNQPGKWRLIVDLPSPEGSSVNDSIDHSLCSLQYASIDDAVATIRHMGQGTLLAKLDLQDAYRIVPVHPQDRPLLGLHWDDMILADAALPFGLRSAPKLFSELADGLIWILHNQGINHALHYLDDFLLPTASTPSRPHCQSVWSLGSQWQTTRPWVHQHH